MSKKLKQPYIVSLKPNRTLLNPKFEGYKLKLFEDQTRLRRFSISPPGISVSKIPLKSKLSYREIQNRIHFNHLFSGYESDDGKKICFYFDRELSVSMIKYDPVFSSTFVEQIFTADFNIPSPLDSDSDATATKTFIHSEHPSLKALSSTLLLATNGFGTIFLVKIAKNEFNVYHGEIIYCTEFKVQPSIERIPCVILDAKIIGESILFLVYNTVKIQDISIARKSSVDESKKTLFDITLVRMSVTPPHDLQVEHTVRGPEIPLYCSIEPNGDGYVIGSNVDYELVNKISTEEIDPMEADQPVNEVDVDAEKSSNKDDKKPPYVWTQTSSDVTLCFQLPPGTPKTAVHCNFSKTHLSLNIRLEDNSSTKQSLPCYLFTRLFDLIDPDSSLWTIESSIGLLTLHIEKHHHGTRWSHVFQQDDGVHETLDPNEFAEFRERLEKYTSDLLDDNETSQISGRSLLQHSIGQEMEESIDHEWREVTFIWIGREGKIGAKTSGGSEFLCRQFESFDLKNGLSMPSVCLKSDVDGLVYSVDHPIESKTHDVSPLTLTHFSTFYAFAFVQASKREKRYMFHDPSNRFVMIFDGSHHAFVYWHNYDRENHGEQFVVDFAENKYNDIDVVGVQMVDSDNAVILVLVSDCVIVIKLL
ncbi:12918_t:CDS:2 [Acaulospora morrowiae]|uniref:NudC domain-containing protein 1 n=1 Tax=Acaulospora morrowiae TaxID=94023 RepID=A0A9N8WB78_9GLOM|nr:12918_t:CDS:2 [Acaulospora morrowiae]